MDTKKICLEEISAFADGELTDSEAEAVIAALRQEEAKDVWNIYHSIGDAMRSDDLSFAMRPDFAARLAARLEDEPTIMAPPPKPARERVEVPLRLSGIFRRLAVPGAAAAAVAVALIAAPQWMATLKGSGLERGGAFVAASAPAEAARVASADASGAQAQLIAVKAQEGVILRDPRIDDYLMAHQRFSPSVYSTAQFARSAAFSADSNK